MLATTWVQIIKAVMLLSGDFHGIHGDESGWFQLQQHVHQSIEVFSKVHSVSFEEAAKIMGPGKLLPQTRLMHCLLA